MDAEDTWGVFFPCLVVPLFPVFTRETGSMIGTVLPEIWCAYFLPICILGYRYFDRTEYGKQGKHWTGKTTVQQEE